MAGPRGDYVRAEAANRRGGALWGLHNGADVGLRSHLVPLRVLQPAEPEVDAPHRERQAEDPGRNPLHHIADKNAQAAAAEAEPADSAAGQPN